MDKIRVLLIEDYMMTRMGLSLVFEKEDDMEVIGIAKDGVEAVEQIKELLPDVAILDVIKKKLSGCELHAS